MDGAPLQSRYVQVTHCPEVTYLVSTRHPNAGICRQAWLNEMAAQVPGSRYRNFPTSQDHTKSLMKFC